MSAKNPCKQCGSAAETRPYGPDGTQICHPCSCKPGFREERERQFIARVEAAGPIALLGTEAGPTPIKVEDL